MTRYGWDTSDYDHGRGPVDVALARKQGIDFLSHKISEGTYFNAVHAGEVLRAGATAKMSVLGGYHVLYGKQTAAVSDQVDWYLQCLQGHFPGYRDYLPAFIHQIDAEKFRYMRRKPTVGEINTFGDLVVKRTGCLPTQVVAYAPKWLYGDALAGLRYRLWASSYVAGAASPQALYPGDGDFRWQPYSGIEPTLLQFSSSAEIGGNHTCDANAVRVDTRKQLVGLFVPAKTQEETDVAMTKEDRDYLDKRIEDAKDEILQRVNSLFSHGNDGDPDQLAAIVRQELRAVGLKPEGNKR